MKLGIRGKLFMVSIIVILAVDLALGVYLSYRLDRDAQQRVEGELGRAAATVRQTLEIVDAEHHPESIDPIADQLSESLAARVTVIAADGELLGDSELTVSQLGTADNHASRPEVVEARRGRRGTARRDSGTIGAELLYLAIPYQRGGETVVVRVAARLEDLDAARAELRWMLVIAGLVGLAGAVLLSAVGSQFMTSTLEGLVRTTRAAARVDGGARVSLEEQIGGLAGSASRLEEDLHRAVGTLAMERDRFQVVLDGLRDAVIAVDLQRRLTLVNPAAKTLLGLEGSVIGRPLLETVRSPPLAELIEDTLEGRGGEVEFSLSRPTPRVIVAYGTARGSGGGAVVVIHDVTDVRRLEKIRRDFVANVSHELRTPVAVIRATVETLLDGALDDPAASQRFLNALLRNSERLGRLISDLLDVSRIEAGQFELDPQALSLAEAVGSTIEASDADARKREITLVNQIDPTLEVVADRKALDQVIANLVDNAIKYGDSGGTIEVDATAADFGEVRIEVRDDGPGIAAPQRTRVFERFYRLDRGRSREMGGTGLGLSIVKHLTEAMGGRVGLDPRTPHGSIFWLTLPSAAGSPVHPRAPSPS